MSEPEFRFPDPLRSVQPTIGIVLGSGLGGFAERLSQPMSVPYAEIDGLPISAVPGHAGRLHVGTLGGLSVAVAQGRVHLYEGWSAREAAANVRMLHQLGVRTILLTNAAGIVNPDFEPGRWMLISDHLNLARQSPLTGGPHFIDQSAVYDGELRNALRETADTLGLPALFEGVYAWVNGPEYETPAEIRMLRTLGADAVGMSTVPEAIQARALGLRIAGLSCLTNYGAGMTDQPLSHEEVMETGSTAAEQLFALLARALPKMEK